MVNYLLQAGANPNNQDIEQNSAILIAAQQKNIPIMRKLLEKGADPSLNNAKGQSAIQIIMSEPTLYEAVKNFLP